MKFIRLIFLFVVIAFSCDAQIQFLPSVTQTTLSEESIPIQTNAQDYYDRLVGLGTTMSAPDFEIVNRVFYEFNNTMGLDGVTPMSNGMIASYLNGATETEAKENMFSSSHRATITNNYGGSYTPYVGYKGNGTNFSINRNINFSTAGPAQNDACIGVFVLDDKSGDNNHEFCAMNAGGSSGTFLHAKRNAAAGYDVNGVINGANTGAGSGRTMISSRAWFHIQRNVSTGSDIYVNGYFSSTNVGTSASPLNLNVIEFAANLNGTISSWSNLTHGFFYVGNSNIDPNKVIEILTKYYFIPHGVSTSMIRNRLILVGDSMTGDEDVSLTGASALSERARHCQSELGTDWLVSQNGNSNREINRSTTNCPSLITLSAAELETGTNTAFTKDVIELFIGTNDFALSTSTSAETAKSDLDGLITNYRAQGKIVIITGIVARGGSLAAGFAAKVTAFRSALLADYSVSTGITNVTSNADQTIFYIDLASDARFQNPADGTYYQVDEVHLNSTAYDIIAEEYIVPICGL